MTTDPMKALFGFDPEEIVNEASATAKERIASVLDGYAQSGGTDPFVQGLLATVTAQGVQISYLAAGSGDKFFPAARVHDAISATATEATHAAPTPHGQEAEHGAG